MPKLSKLIRLLAHPIYREGLRHKVGAAIEHRNFLHSASFSTIIDAGANKGQFSLAARAAQPNARIIAFEPLEKQAAVYERIFAKDTHTQLIHTALGAQQGTADIHIAKRADSSSLLPIGTMQTEVFPGTEEIACVRITVDRLDHALDVATLPHPVLLKIDVQGFELELLKGADKILEHIDGIYVELSFLPFYDSQPLADEVIEWLARRRFYLAGVYHLAYSKQGQAVQADMYFRRRKLSPE